MEKLIDIISARVADAFEAAGYDRALGAVAVSNRPDLCEFQCNGAMAGAKRYKKAPLAIAEQVADSLKDDDAFEAVDAVKPGFLNLTLHPAFLSAYLRRLSQEKKLGVETHKNAKRVILDYGGPNIAKPLHVGHLRSAIIGESLKRILRYTGDDVTGDIHMGDWGMPMGLIIAELQDRQPDLPYFDATHEGAYPKEAPFTVAELEEIYPAASARSKEDEAFHTRAMETTKRLQEGDKGLRALWRHIINVSTTDLKRNYDRLNVSFDLWRGESDVDERIQPMVDQMKRTGVARLSEGALIVDVAEETDKKEVPPCIVLKSDGAALYATTDLATIEQRMEEFRPDEIAYVVDKRQEMHFVQVFRTARKARFVLPETALSFVGFGTMNGKDGKPFKTREGGVPRLEALMDEIEEKMRLRIAESDRGLSKEEEDAVAKQVALAALKYGDLSNQPSKDYVFDPEKFTAFEGDTGPYLLYTIVRVKSILHKYEESGGDVKQATVQPAKSAAQKALQLQLTGFAEAVETAANTLSPNRVCAFLYALANALNTFYHETRILAETDETVKNGYIATLKLCLKELTAGVDLLGFSAPEKM